MKLTRVDYIPTTRGWRGRSLFDELFPRADRRPLIQSPGKPWRVDNVLFTQKQTASMQGIARNQGFTVRSHTPLTSEQDAWPMFRNTAPKGKTDRRVIYVTFEPSLLKSQEEKKRKGK